MTNQNMANREVCDLIFVDYATKKPFLNLDFANVTTTELTGESVFAYGGKGHPKRVQYSGERGGTLTIETQLQSVKLWQLITGGEIEDCAKIITRTETVVENDGSTIILEETPLPETVFVYPADDDCGNELKCNSAGQTVTLKTPLSGGEKVIVYYMKEIKESIQRINIKSTSFPKNFTVYGDTIMKTENDEIIPYRIVAAKCAPQTTMNLSFTNNGEPGAVTITCDLMADDEDNILDLILIDD